MVVGEHNPNSGHVELAALRRGGEMIYWGDLVYWGLTIGDEE